MKRCLPASVVNSPSQYTTGVGIAGYMETPASNMASHSQAHLQIFKLDQAPNQDSKFHLFPQLVKELR